MAAYQGKSVLLFQCCLSLPTPFAWNREETSVRRALERGDASLWEPLTPLWEQTTSLFCIRLHALLSPSSRGQSCLYLETQALAYRQIRWILRWIPDKKLTYCKSFVLIIKHLFNILELLQNQMENSNGGAKLKHATQNNPETQKDNEQWLDIAYLPTCTCQEQLTTQFTQTCLSRVPRTRRCSINYQLFPTKPIPLKTQSSPAGEPNATQPLS